MNGSSTCAGAVQREDGSLRGRALRQVHGESLSATAWKAAGSIPLQKKSLLAWQAERNGFDRYMEAAVRPVRVQRNLKLGGTTDNCSP